MKNTYIVIGGLILIIGVFLFYQNKKDFKVAEEVATTLSGGQFYNRNIQNLETENFTIEIVGCEEGAVSCDDLIYKGLNKNTNESITIMNGKTLSSVCSDNVTPCRFIGYEFNNDGYVYSIYENGKLIVNSPDGVIIVEEEGRWGWENEDFSSSEKNKENISLNSTEGSKYVNDFIHLIALLDEDINSLNKLIFTDTDSLTIVQYKTLEAIGKIIERINQNSIRIKYYESSQNEFVRLHSETTNIFYLNLKNSFEKLFRLEQELLYAENENDLKSYMAERSIISPQVDSSIKSSIDLFTLLPFILLNNENSSEVNNKLGQLMVTEINNLFGEEKTNSIKTGDSAFIAGASMLKKALIE